VEKGAEGDRAGPPEVNERAASVRFKRGRSPFIAYAATGPSKYKVGCRVEEVNPLPDLRAAPCKKQVSDGLQLSDRCPTASLATPVKLVFDFANSVLEGSLSNKPAYGVSKVEWREQLS
jgi:hypothetical protein